LQHLATSASQKQPLQSMIHQKLPSQSTGLVQQTSPPVLNQQAVHQQMQQTAQVWRTSTLNCVHSFHPI
jgi:hypothetical protein